MSEAVTDPVVAVDATEPIAGPIVTAPPAAPVGATAVRYRAPRVAITWAGVAFGLLPPDRRDRRIAAIRPVTRAAAHAPP